MRITYNIRCFEMLFTFDSGFIRIEDTSEDTKCWLIQESIAFSFDYDIMLTEIKNIKRDEI